MTQTEWLYLRTSSIRSHLVIAPSPITPHYPPGEYSNVIGCTHRDVQLFRNSSTCRALCNAGLAADGTKLENIPRCGESQYNGVHISYFSSQQVLANNVKYNSFFSFKVILYEYIVVKTISLTFAKLRKLRKERKNWGSGDCRTRNIS